MVADLPMWMSFIFTVIGVVLSILLARLAYGGVLFGFTLLLTLGIVLFGLHHLVDLLRLPMVLSAEGLEALSSSIFLAAAVYLGYSLRKLIYG